MSQNTPNPNEPHGQPGEQPDAKSSGGPEEVPAPEAPVNEALLFEATEAFIRALLEQGSRTPEAEAIAGALASERLAPFDAPMVHEAVAFLRRLGYLGDPEQPRRKRKAA